MDKNKIIGGSLLVAAFAAMYIFQPTPPPDTAPTTTSSAKGANSQIAGTSTPSNPTGVERPATSPAPGTTPTATTSALIAQVASDHTEATITTLANDEVTVRLTDFGGAVLDVAFKQYPAVQGQPEPYVFNAKHLAPILAFSDYPGLDQNAHYRLVSATTTDVVYQTMVDGRMEVTRHYTLPAGKGDATHDPYRIRHETTFRILPGQTGMLSAHIALSLGTAAPISSRDYGVYLNVARYDGDTATRTAGTDLQGGGLFAALGLANNPPKSELANPGPALWGAVKNQFFASVYTPDKPGDGVISRRVELAPFPDSEKQDIGIAGALQLDLPTVPAGGSTTLGGDLYIGPKEYTRLANPAIFTQKEDKVMQFDGSLYYRIFLTGYVAPFMNWMMKILHDHVIGNWGVAIILMTLLFKTVSLPFTLIAARSQKRMQKLQPLMKAMREKYKDNPQKLNEATMNLFKEHRVNPVGGCIPVLITMPLFVGFYCMLQGTAELRFQSFLWAHDLSAPDTVGHLLGFPINILPLLMGVTMFFQMRLTPQPTMDASSPSPQKMMQFMPFFITAVCYNFSCALALYSTINGMFTITQQLLVNKYARVDDPARSTGPGGRKVKNVTPSNSRLNS